MKKLHYFLVSGKIIFATKDGETGEVMLNALVTNDSRNFPARLIGKGQQSLQLHFFKKLSANGEDPTSINVVDVPIFSISHLGQMSEKEFHAAPEGMKLAEKVGADPFAEPDKPAVAANTVN